MPAGSGRGRGRYSKQRRRKKDRARSDSTNASDERRPSEPGAAPSLVRHTHPFRTRFTVHTYDQPSWRRIAAAWSFDTAAA